MGAASKNGSAGPKAAPVGVIVNGHREGPLLAHTLESLAMACAYAAEQGVEIDVHLVLDRSDAATDAIADQYAALLASRQQVSFGNLGQSREAGIAAAEANEWVAFLDGDDLISRNWLADAYAYASTQKDARDTVFHTEMFVGFGADIFFRRAMRSTDPEFDPLCLIADWYFCNNLFAHRSIFARCPIEPYDHERGIGPEDWHWSCKTSEAGFRRDYVPNTIYFYRMKPLAQSLGMSGGLVHAKSRLFTPETVRKLAKQTPARGMAEAPQWAPAPDTPRLRREVPEWVGEHILDQTKADGLLVEAARFLKNNPAAAVSFPPRTHYGVAEFYRRSAPRLTEAPGKIALFWGEAEAIGGAYLLPRMVEALREANPGRQVVVFSDAGSLAAEALAAAHDDADVVVLDYSAARSKFQIPDLYLAMLTARYFIQFDFERIVNVGSAAFDDVITRFERTIAFRCGKLTELAPLITFDRAEPAFDRFVATLPNRARFDHTVLCLSETIRDFIAEASLHAAKARFSKPPRAAIKDALRLRWSGDRARMAAAYDAVRFSDLFERARPTAAPTPAPGAARDLAVVLLSNGGCPELAAAHSAAQAAGAALHVFTTKAHADLLRQRTAKTPHISVTVLPAWSVGEVHAAIAGVDATWLALLEPGAVVTAQFLDQGVQRLRESEGRGAIIPEAVMRRHGPCWELLEFNEGRISIESENTVLFGGLDPVGAAMICGLRLDDGALAAADASAGLYPNVLALNASREKALRVAAQTMAVNLIGEPWPAGEWAKLMRAPAKRAARRAQPYAWWPS